MRLNFHEGGDLSHPEGQHKSPEVSWRILETAFFLWLKPQEAGHSRSWVHTGRPNRVAADCYCCLPASQPNLPAAKSPKVLLLRDSTLHFHMRRQPVVWSLYPGWSSCSKAVAPGDLRLWAVVFCITGAGKLKKKNPCGFRGDGLAALLLFR